MAGASDIWGYAQAGELLAQAREQANDVHLVHGLDSANPLVVAPTSRTAGDLAQTVAQVGDVVTVSRD